MLLAKRWLGERCPPRWADPLARLHVLTWCSALTWPCGLVHVRHTHKDTSATSDGKRAAVVDCCHSRQLTQAKLGGACKRPCGGLRHGPRPPLGPCLEPRVGCTAGLCLVLAVGTPWRRGHNVARWRAREAHVVVATTNIAVIGRVGVNLKRESTRTDGWIARKRES